MLVMRTRSKQHHTAAALLPVQHTEWHPKSSHRRLSAALGTSAYHQRLTEASLRQPGRAAASAPLDRCMLMQAAASTLLITNPYFRCITIFNASAAWLCCCLATWFHADEIDTQASVDACIIITPLSCRCCRCCVKPSSERRNNRHFVSGEAALLVPRSWVCQSESCVASH
jgi:hypothetical protein